MKIEYHLTPHRVIHRDIHVRDNNVVESVLEKSLWFPKVIKVHIDTLVCCTHPQFSLDGSGPLTDPRLSRFVAFEGSTIEVTCYACKKVTSVECFDTSLLHWRSQTEVSRWSYLPWFSKVMNDSIVTLPNGQAEQWDSRQHVLPTLNQAPNDVVALSVDEAHAFQAKFVEVVSLIRECVHPRLLPYMQSLYQSGKVFVALRHKRDDGYYFGVERKENCWVWPGHVITDKDGFSVCAASRCVPNLEMSSFMKSVVQCIIVASGEYLFIVNCVPVVEECSLMWIHESETSTVRGMSVSYPWLPLALGTSVRWKFYHGTSLSASQKIWSKGFKSNSFHSCSKTYYKCDPPFACCCKGMLGPGVYFAGFEKASSNAGRVSKPWQRASVLQCAVLLGECKFVTPYSLEVCNCGCATLHSDHVAHWYHEQLFDSIVLCQGAGVKREELCVRNPKRGKVVQQHFVKYNERRERVFCSLSLETKV